MHGGIIEFHSLPYPDRSASEHDYFLFIADYRFVFFFVGGIEIRNVTVEFACAGVYHLIYGDYALLLAEGTHFLFGTFPAFCDICVAEAHTFGFSQNVSVEGVVNKSRFEVHDVLELIEEQHIYLRKIENKSQIHFLSDEFGYGVKSVVVTVFDVFGKFLYRVIVEFFHINMAHAYLQRPYGFQ